MLLLVHAITIALKRRRFQSGSESLMVSKAGPAVFVSLCLAFSVAFGLNLSAQEVMHADVLARKWKRTKSLSEPKVETRRTKGAELEIVEVKVDAVSQESFPNLQFGLDTDRLEGDITFRQLAEIAKAMKMAGSECFLIEGHTCDLGGDSHNKPLSYRRALSVKAELIRNGVQAERLQALGFGAEQPTVENTSEHNRSKNRRVQIFRKL